MKKRFTVLLLSISLASLTGCINTQTSISSVPESSTAFSSEIQNSQEETSVEEISPDEKSDEETSTEISNEKSNETSDEKSDEKSDETSDEKSDEKSDETSDEISDEVSDEDESLFSFKIQINGTEYQLPFDSIELRNNGYYLTKDGEVEPNSYSRSVEWKNDNGNTIITQLWNPSGKKQDYNDCLIGSVEIKLGEKLYVVLPGDFVFDLDVTPEKIKEQYGEPESEHIYNDYVTIRYKIDLSKSVEFFIYTKEEYIKFSSVTVKNFV